MNFIIIGASSGLGRALVEELSKAGHKLLLVASDVRDLTAMASDLSLRTSGVVDSLACHIDTHDLWLADLEKKIAAAGDLDGLFFPLGWSAEQDQVCSTPELAAKLMEVNFTAIVKIISHCLPHFFARNRGYIVGFGSVASLRGRSSNVLYAAAKRALTSYFESLRHATFKTNVIVQLYQLGYMDTSHNFGRKLIFPKADPVAVARYVVKNLNRDFGFIFFPRFWFIVQYVVRWLPWRIFKRLNF